MVSGAALAGGRLFLCVGVEGKGALQPTKLAHFPPGNYNGGGDGAVKREL